ncbi:MAG: DNA-binding response regulator [Ignavibacteriales bacterium CG12_big_fil_rev_8_21_14_0_65_30_8]|nr:MAG: DNA-binding response regulator [Ignavibacteriales bacterium CG12_big_fil_rev_8_21_14_0_65_30_8]
MIKVVVVEDDNEIREGLRILIDGTEGYSCIDTYSECTSMLKNIEKNNPDILLMDIGLPGMNGIEGIKKVKEILPEITILVLTVYEENELIFDALCAGASGYLIKKTPPSKLLEAIKEASNGGSPMSSHIARKVIESFQKKGKNIDKKNEYVLTKREKEILSGLVGGNNFKAIADSLFISVETVRFHFRNIYKKLHVHSQSEAVVKAIKEGIV